MSILALYESRLQTGLKLLGMNKIKMAKHYLRSDSIEYGVEFCTALMKGGKVNSCCVWEETKTESKIKLVFEKIRGTTGCVRCTFDIFLFCTGTKLL